MRDSGQPGAAASQGQPATLRGDGAFRPSDKGSKSLPPESGHRGRESRTPEGQGFSP